MVPAVTGHPAGMMHNTKFLPGLSGLYRMPGKTKEKEYPLLPPETLLLPAE
jgi:hypothetical protein